MTIEEDKMRLGFVSVNSAYLCKYSETKTSSFFANRARLDSVTSSYSHHWEPMQHRVVDIVQLDDRSFGKGIWIQTNLSLVAVSIMFQYDDQFGLFLRNM
ncbi:unnamed protein product [Peronospora belbahrii]|uniref:Uncharacterized protein n=1 Tax=Peronospora belbahrii TaxID=622444 RepID=A0AAU9L082_9STRA|nr:unnamed protein product [Peronospora belbahrii]